MDKLDKLGVCNAPPIALNTKPVLVDDYNRLVNKINEIIEHPLGNNNRGQMHIAADTAIEFAHINTYEKVIGVWTDGCANNFTVDAVNSRLIYTGTYSKCALMNGVSDIRVNKACELTYALYKNGNLVTGAITPHTFTAAARTSTISITSLLNIENGDYFEVWAKTDTTGVILTIHSLKILFWGEY